jgi:FkbM family methyltransferase
VRTFLKRILDARGWFLRRSVGLPYGVDLGIDWARLRLPQPQIIFDVGGHAGESVRAFKGAFPRARVFSFEPVAENFATLQRTCAEYEGVQCFNFGLGRHAEDRDMFLSEDSQNHSLKMPLQSSAASVQKVKIATVDSMIHSLGVEEVDILKIDTEGWELDVLAGADSALQRNEVRAVLCEATLDDADTTHSQLIELKRFLGARRMCLAVMYDQVLWRSPLRLAYFNLLFVRQNDSRR